MEGNRDGKIRVGINGCIPALTGDAAGRAAFLDPERYEVSVLPEIPSGGFPDPAVLTGLHAVLPLCGDGGAEGVERHYSSLAELMGIPMAGPDLRQCALGRDRSVIRRLLAHCGLPQGLFRTFTRERYAGNGAYYVAEIEMAVGYPCRIYPARSCRGGGIICRNRAELEAAMEAAFSADSRVMAEEEVPGRALFVALLAGKVPLQSAIGEGTPVPDAAADSANGAGIVPGQPLAPAKLPEETAQQLGRLARQAADLLDASGAVLIRFVEAAEDGRLLVDAVELAPDLRPGGAYAGLWELSGIPYPELAARLVDYAMGKGTGSPASDE
ncbi:hypothetical protein [Gorillibacterium sp. sgz5001074]|uniref:hypothetical protein n=1 Tax=Gorillibacterium sp. sgz5001074 TaxID=3446695 RepID=UPI003F680155